MFFQTLSYGPLSFTKIERLVAAIHDVEHSGKSFKPSDLLIKLTEELFDWPIVLINRNKDFLVDKSSLTKQ